ncbi:hypothetical protein TNCV_4030781 [Trichonephila clavipes]|nr:hypothetical protein TNCV_4030781 [Trichonephila clavipes]
MYNTITEEYRLVITNNDSSIEQKRYAAFQSRREPISGESPTSFPEGTCPPYSGFKPEPTHLQAECHDHYTGWGGITTPKTKPKHLLCLTIYQKLITSVPFWIADTEHRMGERNVYCDLTSRWGESERL